MSSSNLENSYNFSDKLRFFLSVLLFLVGFVTFYLLDGKDFYIRFFIFILSIFLSTLLFITSKLGKHLIYFARDSLFEMRLMSWPSRKESLRITIIVFVFAFVVSLFIFCVDKCIELLLYGFFLGWK